MSQLGQRIRKIRFGKEMTIKELAAKAGVSEQALNGLERGRVDNPGFNTVAGIADALEVSLDFLYRGTPSLSAAELATLGRHRQTLVALQEVLAVMLGKVADGAE